MRHRRLAYFVAVAEELSFTRAAERLHMAQPPLSQQIIKLEHDLGAALFDRSRRGVRLTPAGSALLPEARRLLADLDETARMVRRVGAGAVGSVSIGFVPSAVNGRLPDLLRDFRAGHPDVELVLRELAPDPLLAAVEAGRVDVGVLYRPVTAGGVEHRVIDRESLVLALPDDHPAARHDEIRLADVAGEPFIMPERHDAPGLHTAIAATFAESAVTPRVALRGVWLVHTVLALVAAGFGLAVVPSSAAALGRRGVTLRPIRGATRLVELTVVWSPDRVTHTGSALLTAFEARLPEPAGDA